MLIRLVEEEISRRYSEQEMRCPTHLCVGQEAIATGLCSVLRRSDKVYSNHRAHGHYLAKGGDPYALVAELYGRKDGCSGGRGGSMHLIDLSVGFLGSTPIVGGTVPLAVGAAWAAKIKSEEIVAVVFFGDGCFEEGILHESMNFASLHRLPVIFVCENNQFSVYSHIRIRQPDREIFKLAAAHGIDSYSIDGNDIEAVVETGVKAVNSARSGGGPQFLECRTFRLREHCGPNYDDDLGYRSADEIKAGHADCPIKRCIEKFKISDRQVEEIRCRLEQEIETVFSLASTSDFPIQGTAGDYLYA